VNTRLDWLVAAVILQLEPAKKAPLRRSTVFAVSDGVVVTTTVDALLPDSLINGLREDNTGALFTLLEEEEKPN
jgi:hypothetical protein